MRRIKSTMSRQQETLGVTAIALIVVVLYTLWGAALLNGQHGDLSGTHAAAVVANS